MPSATEVHNAEDGVAAAAMGVRPWRCRREFDEVAHHIQSGRVGGWRQAEKTLTQWSHRVERLTTGKSGPDPGHNS